MNAMQIRNSITALQATLQADPESLTAKDFETEHLFAQGLYSRVTAFPKGSGVVGKIHRESHLLIMLKGKCLVASTEGKVLMEAPFITVAKSGIQRVGIALSDCIFVTVHATELTDLTQIETKLIAQNYNSLEVS